LDLTFFGYNSQSAPVLHKKLFDMVWYSGGKFSWDTIYNIPIHIRELWMRLIQHQINPTDKHTEQQDAENKKRIIEQQMKNNVDKYL